MKKIYPFVFFLFTAAFSSAQLTENNHAPEIGDVYQLFQCDSTGIDPGPAGAGITWTFAPATHSNLAFTYSAIAASNPSYAAADVAVFSGPNDNSYYNSNDSSLLYYGGNIPVPMVKAELTYTTPAIHAVYPMNINSTKSAATGGSMNVTGQFNAQGTFTGLSEVTADGTGTLVVSGFTYNNVYRIVTTQTINFVAVLNGTIHQKNYIFYTPGTKAPLFTISTSTLTAGLLGTSSLTLVTRLNPVSGVGIGELADNAAPSVYPNPAMNEVRFYSEEERMLNIFDLTGKKVETRKLSRGITKVNVSDLSRGLYIYRIEDPEGKRIATGKLTLIH